jgi:hypothetical protein
MALVLVERFRLLKRALKGLSKNFRWMKGTGFSPYIGREK